MDDSNACLRILIKRTHGHTDRDLRLDLFTFSIVEGNVYSLNFDNFTGQDTRYFFCEIFVFNRSNCNRRSLREGASISLDGDTHAGNAFGIAERRHLCKSLGVKRFFLIRLSDTGSFAVGRHSRVSPNGCLAGSFIGSIVAGRNFLSWLLRQDAVALDVAVGEVIVKELDGNCMVAFDGGDASGIDGPDDADVVREAVAFPVEEDQVAGLRVIASGRGVHAARGKAVDPGGGSAVIRNSALGDVGIVQAERDEHGAPVAVWDAVPGTVACPALEGVAFAVFIENGIKVPLTLGVAELGLGDFQEIPVPFTGQGDAGEPALPDIGRFDIGSRIALRQLAHMQGMDLFRGHVDHLEAVNRVNMLCFYLFFIADQNLIYLIAGIVMGMGAFALFLAAGKNTLRLIAFVAVNVAGFALLLAAGKNALRFIALLIMMVGTFALGNLAGQDLFPRIAVIVMDMLGILICADQFALYAGIAAVLCRMNMAVILLQTADEDLFFRVAGIRVGMPEVLFLTAGQDRFLGVAGIGVNVSFALFLGADQNLFLRIAFIPVDVQLTLGQRADQLAVLVAVVIVLMRNRLGTLLGIRTREDTLRIGLRLNAPLQRAENQGRHEDRQNQKHKKPDDTSLMLPDHSVQIRFIHNQILPFPRFKKKNRCEIRNSNDLKSNNSNTVIPNIQVIRPVKTIIIDRLFMKKRYTSLRIKTL